MGSAGPHGEDDQVLGPYRIDRLVGRGGMGEVYRAWDGRRRRWVALKLLDRWTADDPAFRRRFRREAETAARLTDPHVLPVHDYGEIDGRLYLDMRLVDGADLSRVLTDGPLPPARALRLLTQVAEALDAAHAEGLVHRDVKPSNILVGAGDFAYVVDFGLARDQQEVSSEEPSEVLGTLGYMAPERLRGEPADRRADVYSLACVVVECLTGRRPYVGDDPAAVIAGHLHGTPPRPHDRDPSLPVALDDVVARGLALDPVDRYPDAGSLIRAVAGAFGTAGPELAASNGVTSGGMTSGGATTGGATTEAPTRAEPTTGPVGPPTRATPPPTRRGPPLGLPLRTPRRRGEPLSRGRITALAAAGLAVVVLLVLGWTFVRTYVGDGLAVGLSPIAVASAPDGSRLLVVGGGADAVTVVDPRLRAVTHRVPIDGRAIGATVDGDRLDVVTVSGRPDPALVTLDVRSAQVVGVVPLPGPPAGPPAVSADRGRAAVPVRTGVQIVDPATGALRATAPRPARAVAMTPDGARVFALDGRGTTVGVLDGADGRVLDELPQGGVAEEMAVSPDGRSLAVTDDAPALTVLDTATGRVTGRVALPGRPSGVTFTPDGARVLVGTDQADGAEGPAVVAVDPAAGRVVAVYRREPYARTVTLAVSPDGARLYVANTDLGTLTVDDLRR